MLEESGDGQVEQTGQLVEETGGHSFLILLKNPDLLWTYPEHQAQLIAAEVPVQPRLNDLFTDTKFFQAQAFVPLAQTRDS